MRRVDRKVLPYLALFLTACSLVVDFPSKPEVSVDAGPDARVDRDAARDAARDTGPRADAQQSGACDLGSSAGCGDSERCCDRQDGKGPICVDTSTGADCAACGMSCGLDAPHCGKRVCECESGSGQACNSGDSCTDQGGAARCVECDSDADCAGRASATQCASNKCVECDRGAKLNDSSDDQGCPTTAPICDEQNKCGACATAPSNCPTGMQCNATLGCVGCLQGVPVSTNGCGGTKPVCASVSTTGDALFQCRKCQNDNECSGAYCVEATGECVNGCDPDQLPGANHCQPVTPICTPGPTGAQCTVCKVPADCAGLPATPQCSVNGTLSGQCVQCRNNADCSANGVGPTPVCGIAGTCRARTADDCAALPTTPVLGPNGDCVQCATAAQCVGNAAGPYCTQRSVCGQCISDANCAATPLTPVCNQTTNVCSSGCTTDAQCSGTTPHCNAMAAGGGVCVACTAATVATDCLLPAAPLCSPVSGTCIACGTAQANADALCAVQRPGNNVCVTTSGPKFGQCAVCDSRTFLGVPGNPDVGCSGAIGICNTNGAANFCATCDDVTERGCPPAPNLLFPLSATIQCIPVSPTDPATGCHSCDHTKPAGLDGCAAGATCSAVTGATLNTCSTVVVPPADGGV